MAYHHKGRFNRTVGVPIPEPRVFEPAHLRFRCPFRNTVSMEGRVHQARAWRWVKVSASGGLHSSKTAPHFGHLSALSSTSAPQFVHVKAVALEAFSLFVGPAASALGFGGFFGICGSAPRIFVGVARGRAAYHHITRVPYASVES